MSSLEIINNAPVTQVKTFSPTVKKGLLIALTCLINLGAIFAYVIGLPWFVPLSLFALSLIPLFPIGRTAVVNRLAVKNIHNN